MTAKVTIPADLREKLTSASGNPVELCDEAGNVVGYAVTPARMATIQDEHWALYAELDRIWPPEEIAASRSG